MRILHVTESMGAGVLSALEMMTWLQADQGHAVEVVFISRFDTPDDDRLAERFHPDVLLTRADAELTGSRLGALVRQVWRRVPDTDVVHAHSSRAGALARVVAFVRRARRRSVYSPHGFAFLREDLPRGVRLALRLVERVLALLCAGVICVSEGEALIARRKLGCRRVEVLENLVVVPDGVHTPRPDELPTVYTVGRWTAQKAPERFLALAAELKDRANFLWIGGADGVVDAPGVTVTGWIDRSAARDLARSGDIFVLLSRWEGLPIALVESQLLGVPAVVSDIVGNRDVVVDSQTGFVVSDDVEALAAVTWLLGSPEMRASMGRAARAAAVDRFDVTRHQDAWSAAYGSLLPRVAMTEAVA